MNNPPDTSGAPGPPSPADAVVHKVAQRPENRRLLAMLAAAEHGILYLVSFALLALGVGILALMILTVVQGGASGTEKIIVILEELLLVLIVLEIFVTVQTHLAGGSLQLEPFIIVGIIAIIRHILSVVVRLTIPGNLAASRQQLMELVVYAGSALMLVAALALVRWSQRRPALSADGRGDSSASG
ncbi:phosphate-starvation-inducible PsiE family protein [Nonomuraea sp. CA-143628]|uniref:phosphate-starvation-inducible PsiE family protein n=1 Tax=Nonomuraea sp. CA-143628 TaxID=3239997 RepID=UPI003D8A9095